MKSFFLGVIANLLLLPQQIAHNCNVPTFMAQLEAASEPVGTMIFPLRCNFRALVDLPNQLRQFPRYFEDMFPATKGIKTDGDLTYLRVPNNTASILDHCFKDDGLHRILKRYGGLHRLLDRSSQNKTHLNQFPVAQFLHSAAAGC
jgi:hypothetical protein